MKFNSSVRFAFGAASLAAAAASAQPWITFDASLGTLPEAQCWAHREDIDPPMAYPFGIAGGDLHLNTLGFASSGAAGGGVWWERSDVAIDFSTDFAVEARVRIASAPDHRVNTGTGWPRPGYAIAVYDLHGRIFWVGLGSTELFLSNTSFGNYGTPNTVTLDFNTTDTHHVYRLERAAGGVGATLRIDGVPRLTLAALGPIESGAPSVYFGDPTYWANSESYTSWARFSGAGPGPITGIVGPFAASACPGTSAAFSVAASGTGPFSYAWQLELPPPAAPGTWVTLGNDPLPLPCGGNASHAFAQPPNAASTNIRVHGCDGPFRIRCVVSNACGSVTSEVAELSLRTQDFNQDGNGDQDDISSLVDVVAGAPNTSGIDPDLNGDGNVDQADVDALINWIAGGDCP